MPTFPYCFGFETPRQRINNARHGWDDENSEGVLIEGIDEQAALAWGDEIAEHFTKLLFNDQAVSWKHMGFVGWIEQPGDWINALPKVRVGEMLDFSDWLKRHLE